MLLPRLRATVASPRVREPVRVGVPFPRGSAGGVLRPRLRDEGGRVLLSQWRPLARWPDGSWRWALLDFLLDAESAGGVVRAVEFEEAAAEQGEASLRVGASERELSVETGPYSFAVSRSDGSLRARKAGTPRGSPALLELVTLASGPASPPAAPGRVRAEFEELGPLRVGVKVEAELALSGRKLRLTMRWAFLAGTGLAGFEVCVGNPRAALHRGGVWDLGDPGSLLFRDLSLVARLPPAPERVLTWQCEDGVTGCDPRARPIEIFQCSSGGENWRAPVHVNAHGEVPLEFRGYRVASAEGERRGLRASPLASLSGPDGRLTLGLERFWENFPKAIEAAREGITLRLFPAQAGDLHELQGGERKTHRGWLELSEGGGGGPAPLAWLHAPTVFAADPEWTSSSGVHWALPDPPAQDAKEAARLLDEAVAGPSGFPSKRERADEFGWRHFGDCHADHEQRYFRGTGPLVSHYNNQYDLLLGMLVQFLRNGDRRWFELASDLARHVADIDIYHTTDDKPAFNGGLFWHTDHYQSAHRAGHRTYSAWSPAARTGRAYGGGPGNEHNYAAGLLLFHQLTGDAGAREAVLSLAEWVIALDDGTLTPLGPLDPSPTGLASQTTSSDYHGPGRGAGNSIAVLLDGFAATGERRFLDKAEQLVVRCVHPEDDIERLELNDLERRWSYLVFLQALGRYLEALEELGEYGAAFDYARASLLRYARYVRDRETPYRLCLDRVEFPTETWPAHDLRKAVVLGYAARYTDGGERDGFLAAAARFHREAHAGLSDFDSRLTTRPLAIVLQNEPVYRRLATAPPSPAAPGDRDWTAWEPREHPFEPQRARVRRRLRRPAGVPWLVGRLAHPARLAAFVRLAWRALRRR